MKKNGFSLVELLAVIAILSIIMGIASFSVLRTRSNQLEKLLETKLQSLEDAAKLYGQDNQDKLRECNIDGLDSYCMDVTVDELINKGYYKSSEVNGEGKKDLINNVSNKSMLCDKFTIYKKNNRVYAKRSELVSNTSEVCNKGGL